MLGLGKGKIELTLDKTNYAHGETINGTVNMTLKKPINAKGVIATLFAERKRSDGDGGTTIQRVFEFSVPIDGERLYEATQKNYTFQIQVPAENKIAMEGKIGTALKAFSALGNIMSPTKWFVEVKLDIPKGFDVRKKQQINVV